MGGKSKKVTVGYWYKLLYHAGLGYPIDAFLEFRGGDRTAWRGELTSSGTIYIDAENLWGGKKDQGGIVGPVDIMFGDADQIPNPYLVRHLGNQVAAWRGFTTLVFKGGKYGAMNPYPQKASYKIRKILNGWDDECWYPEKAVITHRTLNAAGRPWRYLVVANSDNTNRSAPSFDDSGWNVGYAPFASAPWSLPGDYGFATTPATVVPAAHKVWMRTTAAFSKAPTSARFQAFVDNDCRLYINGTLALTVGANNGAYYDVAIPNGLFVAGTNHIAVEGWDRHSGAGNWFWFDWRITTAQDVKAMNPAHVLYYARTHSTLGREPVENINDASYRAAADKLFDEGFGICTRHDPSNENVDAFEKRIGKLIGGSVSRSLVDGQWYLDLARGDYDLESLPVLTDDDILDFQDQPVTLANAVNSLAVRYFSPEVKEAIVTPAVRAMGLIREFGEISQTNEYLEIPHPDLALRIAERDVRAGITPTRALKLKTTRKPNSWRPGTYFRLQTPKRGIADMVCIVGEKQSGKLRSGAMSLVATQDTYSMPSTTYVQVEPGIDTRPSQTPTAITLQRAFELPFVVVVTSLSSSELADLAADAGFLGTVAADPASSRDYTAMVSPDGAGNYIEAGDGEWCPTATVVEGSTTRMETAFTLANDFMLDTVAVGSAALWGDEVVRVDAIDAEAGTVTLGRGCADTVSAIHAAGERIWFFGEAVASSGAEYAAGEAIDVKLLTNTGSAQLAAADATVMDLTFSERLHRPYPPGKVKIDGSDYPASVDGEFAVTWAHRNRETQADQLVDATVASVTPANNVRYGLRFRRVDTNAVLVERNDIGPNTATVQLAYTGTVRLELWTLDNDAVSWQTHMHDFAYTADVGTVTSTITATAYTPVDDAIIIDGGGD